MPKPIDDPALLDRIAHVERRASMGRADDVQLHEWLCELWAFRRTREDAEPAPICRNGPDESDDDFRERLRAARDAEFRERLRAARDAEAPRGCGEAGAVEWNVDFRERRKAIVAAQESRRERETLENAAAILNVPRDEIDQYKIEEIRAAVAKAADIPVKYLRPPDVVVKVNGVPIKGITAEEATINQPACQHPRHTELLWTVVCADCGEAIT
jgi:hypothetical protein